MATEPNPRMDDLLKTYARERREQAGPPFELHAATRRLLQAEVTRASQQKETPARGKASWFSFLSWQLAWGIGGLAVILAIGGLWLWHEHQSELEMAGAQSNNIFVGVDSAPNGSSPGSGTVPGGLADRLNQFALGATGQAPVVLDQVVGASGSSGLSEQPQGQNTASIPPEPARPGSSPATVQVALAQAEPQSPLAPELASNAARFPAGTLPESEALRAKSSEPDALTLNSGLLRPQPEALPRTLTRYGLPQQAPAPAEEPRNSRLAKVGPVVAKDLLLETGAQAGASNTQASDTGTLAFQQVNRSRGAVQSAAASPVLTRFSLRRSGQYVAVTDSDGSVYPGVVHGPAPKSQAFSFRVAGTNQTLNQTVVFTGTFDPAGAVGQELSNPNLAGAANRTPLYLSGQPAKQYRFMQAPDVAANSMTAGRQTANQTNAPTASGRIEGDASVGGDKDLKIEAWQVVQ